MYALKQGNIHPKDMTLTPVAMKEKRETDMQFYPAHNSMENHISVKIKPNKKKGDAYEQ